MSLELWGTFSVRDHTVPRAFLADVLLYDRLVIPTLPEHAPDDEWPAEWDLAKQRTLLRDLGDLAIPIPWDKGRQEMWQQRFDHANADERHRARAEATGIIAKDVAVARAEDEDLPYQTTRTLLQDFANNAADDQLFKKLRVTRKVRPGSVLEAVSAYPNFRTFARDVGEAPADTPEITAGVAPTKVFGWQFFVPDSATFGEDEDRRLLEKAMKLATTSEFILMREDFYQWWSDVSASGMPVAEARADMEKRIAEYQALIKGQRWKTVARYAMKIADAFSGFLGLFKEVASAGAEAFLGTADIFADERMKRADAPDRLKVAAIFHDARREFDKRGKMWIMRH